MDTRPRPRGSSPHEPTPTATRPARGTVAGGGRARRGDRRGEILRHLRERNSATAGELADAMDVHPNTVRFHLAVLEREGDVVRRTAPARSPGRPEIRYSVPPATDADPQRPDLLARILLARIAAAADPVGEAEDAGYQWGQGEVGPAARGDGSAVDGLVDALDSAGFAPALSDGATLELRNCPLREFLSSHGRLVCSVHRGMMTGFLDAAGSSNTVDSLEPFATPTSCRALLRGR